MAYTTPSPSDSTWSSSFGDCANSETSNSTGWAGPGVVLPITPPMPMANMSNLHRFSVTSAPKTHNTTSTTPSPTSSTSTAGAPTARGRKYAKDDDWMRHRARITDMYLVQKRTLREVMSTMEDKHNFVATERMYKARFKEWGCGKNITAAQVHKLMIKLNDRQNHVPYADGTSRTTVLDVGDELDVPRIQKYMKRKPVGLKRLERDPTRPLDVIKALSVDKGKGRLGRAKVSIATAKLEYQQPQTPLHLISPQSDLMMPWSPSDGTMQMDGLPDDMTHLLQTAVDQEFNIAYSYAYSPLPPSSATSSPWQSLSPGHNQLMGSALPLPVENSQIPDQMMLDFVLKFRTAHILLDDGLTVQAFEVVNLCMSILTTRLHQTQGSDSRAAGTVILYALTAALEMSIGFTHLEVLHMLFQHINNVCGEQQPRMAEIARRMPQLNRMQQVPMLKLARMMMSRAAVGYSGHENPSYEVYSRTVDIAISHQTEGEKLRELQVYLTDPVVQSMPQMVVWMEERIALAVCSPSMVNQQAGFWNGHTPVAENFPVWKQGDKIAAVMKYSLDRIDWLKMVGNWAMAERWTNGLGWLVDLVQNDELLRRFRAGIESSKSPILGQTTPIHIESKSEAEVMPLGGGVGVSLPPMQTLHSSISHPDMRGFKQEMVSSPSWDHTHGQFHDHEITLPSLWNATGGVMDGMSGVGLYDTSSSF